MSAGEEEKEDGVEKALDEAAEDAVREARSAGPEISDQVGAGPPTPRRRASRRLSDRFSPPRRASGAPSTLGTSLRRTCTSSSA